MCIKKLNCGVQAEVEYGKLIKYLLGHVVDVGLDIGDEAGALVLQCVDDGFLVGQVKLALDVGSEVVDVLLGIADELGELNWLSGGLGLLGRGVGARQDSYEHDAALHNGFGS